MYVWLFVFIMVDKRYTSETRVFIGEYIVFSRDLFQTRRGGHKL